MESLKKNQMVTFMLILFIIFSRLSFVNSSKDSFEFSNVYSLNQHYIMSGSSIYNSDVIYVKSDTIQQANCINTIPSLIPGMYFSIGIFAVSKIRNKPLFLIIDFRDLISKQISLYFNGSKYKDVSPLFIK